MLRRGMMERLWIGLLILGIFLKRLRLRLGLLIKRLRLRLGLRLGLSLVFVLRL